MVSDLPDNTTDRTSQNGNSDVASEPPSGEGSPSSFLWLTNRDQWLAVIVSVVVVALLAVKWQKLRYVDRSEVIVLRESEEIGYQIDLNSATVTAKSIVSNREEFGRFTSIDDLQRVKGIGPKTVEKNQRWLQVLPGDSSIALGSDR